MALFFPTQGLLQANPSGDLFFMSAPYSRGGLSGASVNIQWFTAGSRFSQVASFLLADTSNPGVGSFVLDPSGNLFVATGAGSIMEITSS